MSCECENSLQMIGRHAREFGVGVLGLAKAVLIVACFAAATALAIVILCSLYGGLMAERLQYHDRLDRIERHLGIEAGEAPGK